MAFIYADRVQESSTTTGTGTLALAGAVAGFKTFVAGIGLTNESYYTIVADDKTWEVGRGTVGVASLSRDTILDSSNGGLVVNFAVGVKSVFVTAPAAFHAGALNVSSHSGLSHIGLPGVPAAEAFTSGAHSTTNHAGILGVGDLTVAAHNATDHTGFTGVPAAEAFTSGVHSSTDHAGITGVGLTTKQRLLLPAGWPYGSWVPNQASGATLTDSILGGSYNTPTVTTAGYTAAAPTVGADVGGSFINIPVSEDAGAESFYVNSDALLFGAAKPRLVFKMGLDLTKSTADTTVTFRFGIGATAATLGAGAEDIWFEALADNLGNQAFSVERRVGGAAKTPTLTGLNLIGNVPYYFVIEYTGVNDVTVSIYDNSFTQLFITLYSGATEVPQITTQRMLLWSEEGGAGGSHNFNFYYAMLSHAG